ncbi:hypothetical protein CPB85DRAFT_155081 [Mucidula mucida]|nr:hypothetical protein CPB85DRAFT_155081 [Mucidula mucida]
MGNVTIGADLAAMITERMVVYVLPPWLHMDDGKFYEEGLYKCECALVMELSYSGVVSSRVDELLIAEEQNRRLLSTARSKRRSSNRYKRQSAQPFSIVEADMTPRTASPIPRQRQCTSSTPYSTLGAFSTSLSCERSWPGANLCTFLVSAVPGAFRLAPSMS